MRRILSVWLPHWPVERLSRAKRHGRPTSSCSEPDKTTSGPFALIAAERGNLRLTAVNGAAQAEGLCAGQSLTDARALIPGLITHAAAPQADAKALTMLADWCVRYTPWTNVNGNDSLWLDITGCAHLFGGETALVDDLVDRLKQAGITARPGLADTLGAAFAVARFSPSPEIRERIIAPKSVPQAVAPLPVEALRLSPDTLTLLIRLGLRTIGDLSRIPRAPLARRFRSPEMKAEVLTRLDQALGLRDEPLSPLVPVPAYRTRLDIAEPIHTQEGVEHGLETLLTRLCEHLADDLKGSRRLSLAAYCLNGQVSRITIAAGQPSRDPKHFTRLFADHLERIDPGFGIETMILASDIVHGLGQRQISLTAAGADRSRAAMNQFIDRLSNRLGPRRVERLLPRESHTPERAEVRIPALRNETTDAQRRGDIPPRPFRLLARPEPIHVVAEVPEGPPRRFVWRRVARHVVRAEGPERIAPEWWLEDGADHSRVRDYYRIEDGDGRRFWLYREGLYQLGGADNAPRWFLHGLFA